MRCNHYTSMHGKIELALGVRQVCHTALFSSPCSPSLPSRRVLAQHKSIAHLAHTPFLPANSPELISRIASKPLLLMVAMAKSSRNNAASKHRTIAGYLTAIAAIATSSSWIQPAEGEIAPCSVAWKDGLKPAAQPRQSRWRPIDALMYPQTCPTRSFDVETRLRML